MISKPYQLKQTIGNVIAVLLVILSFNSFAKEPLIKVAVNIGAPWAYYDESKGVTGIDVEIIRKALKQLGYQSEFHLLAYNRLIEKYNKGEFDIASPAAFDASKGKFSQKYLPFEDVAISLSSSGVTLTKIDDLKRYKIVAYQHAKSVLGEQFSNIVDQTSYEEMALREVQLTLLMKGRVDVVIGERRLLTFILNKLYPNTQVNIHRLFPANSYGAVIKDPQLASLFDSTLDGLKKSGEYQAILDTWR